MKDCQEGFCETSVKVTDKLSSAVSYQKDRVIYVGDPMCSWCYGMSDIIEDLQSFCDARKIDFEVIMGGLRTGGRDVWTPQFRYFLQVTWNRITEVSGQKFNHILLQQDYFDYDTTPSCEAVVIAKTLLIGEMQSRVVPFMKALQQKFYLGGEDPKAVQFYQSICELVGIDYQKFRSLFNSDPTKIKTKNEFDWCKNIGVQGFPTFLLVKNGQIQLLASGYISLNKIIRRFEQESVSS